MLPENITCAFKNKAPFIKLEIKSEYSYYLDARTKNWDFISSLIWWNLSDKSIITHKKITTCSTQNSKNIFPEQKLMQTWIALTIFLVLAFGPEEKVNYELFIC